MMGFPMPRTTEPASPYEQYSRQVYAWAYRLLGRHHDALDVAQDVFVRWVRQEAEAAPAHPRAWLRRVTINRAIDVLRARRESPAAAAADAASEGAPAPGLELDELRAAVANALADLSDQQRTVLVAKVYDGLTFARIAEELGLAVPTVKTHYLRALAAVRDRLAPRWGRDPSPGARS